MELRVLGSAQDAGVPQIGCACVNCADPSRHRTASSVAIVADGEALLLDTAPDLRAQWPRIGAPVTAVAWTHAHAGHVAGAPLLGREGPDLRVPAIATPSMMEHLLAAAPHVRLTPQTLAPGAAMDVGTLRVAFHPVQHRGETSDTVAIDVALDDRHIVYLPDTDGWDDHVEAAVDGLGDGDVLLFDATFWSADELRHRDVEAIPHPFVRESLPRLAPLAEAGVHVLLTHLNHTNPLLDPGSEPAQKVRDRGLEVARDGQSLRL